MVDISPIERLKNLEKEIEKSTVEAGVYQKQLKELIPVRKDIEQQCVDTYKKTIDELPEYKTQLEKKFEQMVDELESEVAKVKEESPDG
jgi:hypothetical protein